MLDVEIDFILYCWLLLGHLLKKKNALLVWSVHSEVVPEPVVLFAGGWVGRLWQVDRLCIVVH